MRCTSISVNVPDKWVLMMDKIVATGDYDNTSDYIREQIRISLEKDGLIIE
jgi:Arc/MetJ-type ribon-helix-helix transcriptional regulator